MSQENVEIVRAAYDALSRGDIDAALKDWARDAEYDTSRAVGPVHGIYRGRDEIRKSWEEFSEPWESQRWEATEFIEHGDHVVTPMTNSLRGRDGIEVRARLAFHWTIRDGTVTRVCLYQERREALEAAGLSE